MKLRHRLRAYAIEAVIGLGLAALVVVVAWTSSGEVPFVYRGL
jgi:hypothetical protein